MLNRMDRHGRECGLWSRSAAGCGSNDLDCLDPHLCRFSRPDPAHANYRRQGGPLERNMVDRGGSSSSDECAGIHRALEPAGRDEQDVVVLDRNILNLATEKFLQIYLLLLKSSRGAMEKGCLSVGGKMSGAAGGSYDL